MRSVMVGIFRLTITLSMDVVDTFMPTAGVVGILPMVTYFFLVVAIFAFVSNFIFALATQSSVQPEYRITHALTAMIAFVASLSYYLIQFHYHNTLAELVSVTDANDRQTLLRESYNAIGQYRYMDWFITAPLLLIQLVSTLNLRLSDNRRILTGLLLAASLLFFVSYIGHQQLSFDNEILVGRKVIWGLPATLAYGFILFMLYRLRIHFSEHTEPDRQRAYRLMSLAIAMGWGIYLVGYFLTVSDLDLNWIHLIFTITDLITKIGVSILIYFVSIKSLKQNEL